MTLLTIGTDHEILKPQSEARRRMEAYARLFRELHIVIYTPPGFDAARSGNLFLYPTNSRFYFLRPWHAFRLGLRITAGRKIDWVSVQDPAESGLAGWLVKRATGLPLHIQIHADFFSPFFRRNSWKELLRYWVARFVVPRGDALRVVSERIKQSLLSAIRYPLAPIAVLPIFVDREKIARAEPAFDLHQKYPQFDFIILIVARLVREKNIGLALEALVEVRKEFPKTGLVIAGDGPERENLQLTTSNLQLTGNVRFEGRQDDTVSYYKTADLYLLTSNFEGYSRSAVEAAAAGLPVIMTDVGVAGEMIKNGETGRVVPVGEKNALVRALLDARRNITKSKEMAGKAQKLVLAMEPRTWEEYLKHYHGSLEATLNGDSDAM